ncbi:hypothetical protein H2509_00315 [Stappia sp. F7233]|uniref:Lipoprotein n=1 Tax=Stappia albiluteola TaxID=2758565 RepID=A0A839A8B0_9HYPH|nr:hypothetical protein [Stappia albiluteola]MBA5775561.1 hypothetical protein [Stappia albiluteola]
MKNLILAVLLPAGLGACTASQPQNVLPLQSPADAQIGLLRSADISAIGEYTHRVPIDPKPWRQLNDEQAPGAGGDS